MYTKDSLAYNLDLFCSKAEDTLSRYAAIPILGTVPALLKVAFGAAQFTAAVTTAAFSLFFCTSSIGQEIFLHSLRHVFHGLVNVLAGALQAIPVIGTIVYAIQESNRARNSDMQEKYTNAQSNKFFGYRTIRDSTWEHVVNCDNSSPIKANDIPKDARTEDVIIAAI